MKRRGFLLSDVLLGLAIVAMLATALVIALGRQRKAADRLSHARSAVRLAEESMASLKAGGKIDRKEIRVRRLDAKAPAAGLEWVEVTASVEGEHCQLVGTIPAEGRRP